MIEKLNNMFLNRYVKLFAELNRNVIHTDPDTEGNMLVPIVSLGAGGATIQQVGGSNVISNSPAEVSIQTKEVKAERITYRINIPVADAELAAQKPEYFNFLMDNIMNQALTGYNATFGGSDVSRFGKAYCVPVGLFMNADSTQVELQLEGMWASNQEVKRE